MEAMIDRRNITAELAEPRDVNQYLLWMQYASAVVAPVALLLSWHFELRTAGLTERLTELYVEHGATGVEWSHLATLEQSARDAGASAVAWSRLLNLSAGALVATSIRRLVIARVVPTLGAFLRESGSRLFYRWRRHQLLAARHRREVTSGTIALSTLLSIFAVAFAAFGLQWRSGYGLVMIGPALIVVGVVLFLAANIVAGRATSLASRVRAPWGFADLCRFIFAASIFGVASVISGAIVLLGAAWLSS